MSKNKNTTVNKQKILNSETQDNEEINNELISENVFEITGHDFKNLLNDKEIYKKEAEQFKQQFNVISKRFNDISDISRSNVLDLKNKYSDLESKYEILKNENISLKERKGIKKNELSKLIQLTEDEEVIKKRQRDLYQKYWNETEHMYQETLKRIKP